MGIDEKSGFVALIEALTIFSRYAPGAYSPTHCEHDILHVMVDPADVSPEDKARLEELSFHESDELENFYSYRFGSA